MCAFSIERNFVEGMTVHNVREFILGGYTSLTEIVYMLQKSINLFFILLTQGTVSKTTLS